MNKHILRLIILTMAVIAPLFLSADIDPNPPEPPPFQPPTSPTPPPGTTSTGTFAQEVQTNTTQALQTFQNVNYKSLSGQQSQNDFFNNTGDDDSDDANGNPIDTTTLMTQLDALMSGENS